MAQSNQGGGNQGGNNRSGNQGNNQQGTSTPGGLSPEDAKRFGEQGADTAAEEGYNRGIGAGGKVVNDQAFKESQNKPGTAGDNTSGGDGGRLQQSNQGGGNRGNQGGPGSNRR